MYLGIPLPHSWSPQVSVNPAYQAMELEYSLKLVGWGTRGWVQSRSLWALGGGREDGWADLGLVCAGGWGTPMCQGNVYDCVKGVSVCG